MHSLKLPELEWFEDRLGIPPKLWTEPHSSETLSALGKLEQIKDQFQIDEDLSPVMESRSSFAAKLERGSKTIVINGHLLRTAPHRELAKDFLIGHELGHEFFSSELDCDRLGVALALKRVRWGGAT